MVRQAGNSANNSSARIVSMNNKPHLTKMA
nr:MAG TPA: hypothetical protein [Caudoviricetes sp.]